MIKTNSPVRNPWSQFCSVHINNEEKKEKKKRKEKKSRLPETNPRQALRHALRDVHKGRRSV